MAEYGFDEGNKSKSVFDIDRLTLDSQEKARIAIMDEKVQMEMAHWINEGEKGKYYLCLGDYEIIKEAGVDTKACPACAVASPDRDGIVSMPRRRFALNIARYRTNNKGVVTKPISLALNVWVFSDDKFNKLVDRKAEHGDLRKHDIILTCTAKNYQNMDMDVSGQLMFADDKSAKEQYIELKKERTSDIVKMLGTAISYEAMEAKLSEATPAMTEDEMLDASASAVADVMLEIEDSPSAIASEASDPLADDSGESTTNDAPASSDVDLDSLLDID